MNTQTQPVKTNSTNILKLRSSEPASLKEMIQNDLNQRLQNLETGLQQTQVRLQQLETQYQLSTKQFVELFTNDQLQHSLDFDEWLGEAWMLEKLQQKIEIIKEIEFVD
jgi:nucleotidyltransferase/DNA polymerase involved in DNA repair